MYNVSSETLVNIAFTKIIKFSKNQNFICAIPGKGVQERKFGLHLFAGDCMIGKNSGRKMFTNGYK
jgi:hypothetical protein